MTACMIRSRIDPKTKALANQIFAHMGLTMSDAVRLFLYQTVAEKNLPFRVHIPNDITIKTFEDTDANCNLVRCDNVDDMFKKLGIEAKVKAKKK